MTEDTVSTPADDDRLSWLRLQTACDLPILRLCARTQTRLSAGRLLGRRTPHIKHPCGCSLCRVLPTPPDAVSLLDFDHFHPSRLPLPVLLLETSSWPPAREPITAAVRQQNTN
ncbi:unnamed protein product [Pleuronectes platessa]|uniref:Uncharacterized protein n=1 Tax=Pleuronectes platessa TaxID=8262 RepID=A0A9N7YU30_PLEPL|nr:unnamed protein product [Pleuronectes platessa]